MRLTRVLMRKSAAERIREHYLRGAPPKIRRPSVLSEKENEYYEKVFCYFDKNNDKYLNSEEFKYLVRFQSNDQLQDFDVNKPFNRMDINDDRRISLQEYLEHISKRKKKQPLHRDLQEIFNLYDTNSDAHINLDELRQILLYMGEDYGRTDLRELFVKFDRDKDGLIDVFQFIDLITMKLRQTAQP